MELNYSRKIDLNKFLNHPGILHKFKDDLVIFNYNHKCQYDRLWDDISIQARGLITNRYTGEIIARPFKKFFNLNERPETTLKNLPDEPFSVTIKEDGVLGISYIYNKNQNIATRGSFTSPWALWATEWLNNSNNMNCDAMNPDYTYLFEIISPESKILIDYKGKESLILIGVIDIISGKELSYEDLLSEAKNIKAEPVRNIKFNSIEEMVNKSKIIPKDHEGWVVTYNNGLKIKIKGEEYKKIYKLLKFASPLSFWDAWSYDNLKKDNADYKDVGIPKTYLMNFDEEFYEDVRILKKVVDDSHWNQFHQIGELVKEIEREVNEENLNDDGRLFYKKINERKNIPKKIRRIIMFYKKKHWWKVWGLIHQNVRPSFNKLSGFKFEGIFEKYNK